MRYEIRRLPSSGEDRRSHLYDDQHQLLLVADYGSAWLADDGQRRVRFSQPDGKPLSSLDLPAGSQPRRSKVDKPTSYPLIFNDAVYALVSAFEHPSDGKETRPPYLTVEVEGDQWLVLPQDEKGSVYALYDEVPSGLSVYAEPTTADLPEPVGHINRETVEPAAKEGSAWRYVAQFPAGHLTQAPLILLALTFLIDRRPQQAR